MKARNIISVCFFILFFAGKSNAQIWLQSQDSLLEGVSGLNTFVRQPGGYFTGNYDQLYHFPALNQPWQILEPNGIPPIERSYNLMYGHQDSIFVVTRLANVYLSTDEGLNWQPVAVTGFGSGTILDSIARFTEYGDYYIGTDLNNTHSFVSSDGINWIPFGLNAVPMGSNYLNASDGSGGTYVYNQSLQIISHITSYSNPAQFTTSFAEATGQYEYFLSFDDSLVLRKNRIVNGTPIDTIGQFIPDQHALMSLTRMYHTAGNYQFLRCWYTSPTGAGQMYYYYSTDGGNTWNTRNDLDWMDFQNARELGTDTLLAADWKENGYRMSVNSGVTWTRLYPHLNGMFYLSTAYSPSLDTLIMNTSLYYSGDEIPNGLIHSFDGGHTWSRCNNGIALHPCILDSDITIYSRIDGPYQTNGNYLISCYDDNQFYNSTDGGNTWNLTNQPHCDHPIFAGQDDNELFFFAFQYSSTSPDDQTYMRSGDLGQTWDTMSVFWGDTIGGNAFTGFYFQGHRDTIVCRNAQYNSNVNYQLSRLSISYDDGHNWSDITPPIMVNHRAKQIDIGTTSINGPSLIAFGNTLSEFAMVVMDVDTSSNYYYYNPVYFHDSIYWFDGSNWSVIQHSGLPADIDIQSILIQNGFWFIGSNYGPFVSFDNGLNWNGNNIRIGQGGPVYSLSNNGLTGNMKMYQLRSNTASLKTATIGNGIWEFNLVTGSEQNSAVAGNANLNLWPSLANAGTEINWTVSSDMQNCRMLLLDENGKTVQSVFYPECIAAQTMKIETSKLPPAVYTLVLFSETTKQSGRFVLVK